MDFSKLSYSQVQALAEQLNSSSTAMESLLNEIKTLFAKIGDDGVWSGTAASETKTQFDALSGKFPEFSSAVKSCYDYLMRVVENYKAVDATVTGK